MATQKNNTPGNTPAATGVSTPEYTPINADKSKWDADLNSLKEVYANDPYHNQAYETDALLQQMQNEGINTDNFGWRSQQGGYTKDQNEAIAGGGSGAAVSRPGKDGVWYEKPGVDRQEAPGTSRADEDHLNDAEYAYVQYCKEKYAEATTQEEKDYWHNEAEKVRAQYGYSGGSDGSTYFALGQLGAHHPYDDIPASNSEDQSKTEGGSQNDLKAYLDAWQEAALQQSNAKVDYAVAKAVADLERALADAQPQFKEQAESVDRSARQAMDNSALYAELRGDKGGIGGEQYNAIQNTRAQNQLTVQQAQTKLATDTQRQIADLRAQGEFEKADAALQITQQYLQQLIGLEQWAAEHNLSVDQFNESIRQWETEYNMAMQQLQISQNQWQAEFDAAQNQWQQEFDYTKRSDMANIGWALLESGVSLSKEQLEAMGIDEAQASQILMQAQLENAYKNGETSTDFGENIEALYLDAQASGSPMVYLSNYYKKYGLTSKTGLEEGYEAWLNKEKAADKDPNGDGIADASVAALGLGNIGFSALEDMVEQGILETDTNELGLVVVRWANGWNANKYRNQTLY